MLPNNQAKKQSWGILLSSEENACFIKTQSLTGLYLKKTRQVIKISRHGFLEKGVKKTEGC